MLGILRLSIVCLLRVVVQDQRYPKTVTTSTPSITLTQSDWAAFNRGKIDIHRNWFKVLKGVIDDCDRHAHFLQQDFKVFDAPFFSITPKEAKAMDPTHRMLLEATYEGFENGMFLQPLQM
jgi:hypothetical protein